MNIMHVLITTTGDDSQWKKKFSDIEDPEDPNFRNESGISYLEQHKLLKRVFEICEIDFDKITHASRGVAARRLRVRSQGNTSMVASKGGWTRDKDNNVMDE